MIRVNRLHFPVTALGPGRRLGIWVQGCGLACRGCLAKDTWNPENGQVVQGGALLEHWDDAVARGATGLTISGGEPLDQPHGVAELLTAIREAGHHRADLLVYTGYELTEAHERAPSVLQLADAVITGRFEAARPTRLLWRGSANQRLIPLSRLGTDRFEPFLDAEADRPPAQVAVEDDRVWFVGVPRAGDLPAIERRLRAKGFSYRGVTWRA